MLFQNKFTILTAITIITVLILFFTNKKYKLSVELEKGKGIVSSVSRNKVYIDYYFYNLDNLQNITDENGKILNLSPEGAHSNGIITTATYTKGTGTVSLKEGDIVYFDTRQSESLIKNVKPQSFGRISQSNDKFTAVVQIGSLSNGDNIVLVYYDNNLKIRTQQAIVSNLIGKTFQAIPIQSIDSIYYYKT